jgi:hypothetical protein
VTRDPRYHLDAKAIDADLEVTIVELLPQLLPFLDWELAKLVENHVKGKSVRVGPMNCPGTRRGRSSATARSHSGGMKRRSFRRRTAGKT